MPQQPIADYKDPTKEAIEEKKAFEDTLYSAPAEVKTFVDLLQQRGTPIPALFNQFYKFVQNPSSVSVETFKRMIDTDDTIGSGVDFLTTCLAARLGRYTHPSEEVTKFVNDALDNVEGGWMNAVKELLSASWSGFAVQEKVWANTENGFVPHKLVTLPPTTILFETERTGELTEDGILQYQRNYNPALFATGTSYMFGFSGFGFASSFAGSAVRPDMFAKLGDLPFPIRTANTYSYLSIRIPKQKCIHYSFDAQGKFGNPYGRSLLRRAYKYYVLKDAFLQMLGVALDRKGTPLTIVFSDPNTTILDKNKMSPGELANGKSKGIRADVAAADAFKNIHNDSTIFLPGKKGQIYDIESLSQGSNHDAFITALDFCNKSMMRAMLLPSLIFTSGDGSGSFALGEQHAKTFDKICDGLLDGCAQVILNQLVKEIIAYNFPKEAWVKHGLGKFGKRDLSVDERNKEMEVVEKAVNLGAVDMNDLDDLNQVRDRAGFTQRSELIVRQDSMMQFDEEGNPISPEEGDPNATANGSVPPGKPGVEGKQKDGKPGQGQPKADGFPPKGGE